MFEAHSQNGGFCFRIILITLFPILFVGCAPKAHDPGKGHTGQAQHTSQVQENSLSAPPVEHPTEERPATNLGGQPSVPQPASATDRLDSTGTSVSNQPSPSLSGLTDAPATSAPTIGLGSSPVNPTVNRAVSLSRAGSQSISPPLGFQGQPDEISLPPPATTQMHPIYLRVRSQEDAYERLREAGVGSLVFWVVPAPEGGLGFLYKKIDGTIPETPVLTSTVTTLISEQGPPSLESLPEGIYRVANYEAAQRMIPFMTSGVILFWASQTFNDRFSVLQKKPNGIVQRQASRLGSSVVSFWDSATLPRTSRARSSN